MPTENIDPTVQYLTEQFGDILEQGLPLADTLSQEILHQVQMYGVAEMLISLVWLMVFTFMWTTNSWLYKKYSKIEHPNNDQQIGYWLGILTIGVLSIIPLGCFIDLLYDGLVAYFAPAIWILQQM